MQSKKSFKINNLRKFMGGFLACLICVSIALMPTVADAKTKQKKVHKTTKAVSKPYNPPYAHIVIDAATGRVLYQSDADRALYPASLTKIMTLLMLFEALDTGKVSLRSPVIFSSHAVNMPPSRLGIRAGQSITVETAIRALVTKSANDVAVAVGEKLGGDETRFAQMMNLKARQIGMAQTHFENASGLHNVRQVSSARDMSKLAVYLMQTYPRYYPYFSLKEFQYGGQTFKTHNHLMETYRGMDGLKTGYIAPSGFNLVATAKRGNLRLIGVIFGGKSANSRNTQMATLLDAGFAGKRLDTDPVSTAGSAITAKTKANPNPNAVLSEPGKQILTLNAPIKPGATTGSGFVEGTNLLKKPVTPETSIVQQTAKPSSSESWAIQIGAYQDRVSTDQALFRALKKLPAPLNQGTALVVPLRTSDARWVFRARIEGYTRDQAIEACKHLRDCLTVSPNAN